MKKFALALVLGAAATFSAPALAATLIGNSISGSVHFPVVGQVYGSGSFSYTPNPFTVLDQGPEATLLLDGFVPIEIDFDANSLVLTVPIETGFANADFTGLVFDVVAGNPFGDIASVTSPAGQVVVAFLLDGGLYVNLSSVSFNPGDQVTVTFEDATTVPLPAALPLLAGGIGATAWIARRRTRQPHAAT